MTNVSPRNEHGRFVKGGPGGPGRPKGCKQYFPRGDRRFLERQLQGMYDAIKPHLLGSLTGNKRGYRKVMSTILDAKLYGVIHHGADLHRQLDAAEDRLYAVERQLAELGRAVAELLKDTKRMRSDAPQRVE